MTTQQLFIDSEVGELQAELVNTQSNGTIAVLCHPHPLYGGSMHDAVLSVAAECAAHAGLSSLRFNFRGVGASAGQHQPAPSAPNEIADLLAVINWVKKRERTQEHCGYWLLLRRLCGESPDGSWAHQSEHFDRPTQCRYELSNGVK